jgi:hypothetical protein
MRMKPLRYCISRDEGQTFVWGGMVGEGATQCLSGGGGGVRGRQGRSDNPGSVRDGFC